MATCKTCAAPLESDSVSCTYCGTRNQVDLHALDNWTVTGLSESRSCPCCDINLETIAFKSKKRIEIERCPQCDGLFFDPNELQYIVDHAVDNVFQPNNGRLKELRQHLPDTRRSRHDIPCPVCQALMNSTRYGYRSGIIVDWCRHHGFWLDSGELRHLLDWAKAGGELIEEPKIDIPGGNPPTPPINSTIITKTYFDTHDTSHDLAGSLIRGFFKILSS